MKPISKVKITGLAFGVAAFFVSSLMALPQSKQYPEYKPVEPAAAITETTAKAQPAAEPVKTAPAKAAPAATNAAPAATKTAPAPVVVENSKPVAAPAKSVVATPLSNRFDSNLVTVEKTLLNAPGDVGSDYQYRVRVTALTDVKEVRITEHLPEGVTYVGASPDVAKSGNDLNWGYATMSKGEQQDTIITVRPNQDGQFITSTKVCVDPALQLGFAAGTPRLVIEKVGPREAELNSQIAFNVKVTNVGTAVARNVVIVDNLPEGLKADTAQPSFDIGNLNAGESKIVNIPVTAAAQGEWLNKATATASNAASVNADAPVTVTYSRIGVSKVGPDRQTITRDATYNIAVKNEGSSVLNNVTVTDDLPKGTRLVAASDSPVTQNNDRVVWTISTLRPEEVATRTVTLTASEPMTTTNKVTATAGKVTAAASATTVWDGPPGVLTEIMDNVDPIRVGGPVTYTIRVTNQGAYREVNSQIRVIFSDEVTPISCSDSSASINGKVVMLPDTILKPRGVITFTIQAKGAQEGIATVRLEFNSSFLPKPINKDETTYVY